MTARNVSIRNQTWFSDDKLCAVIDRAYSHIEFLQRGVRMLSNNAGTPLIRSSLG